MEDEKKLPFELQLEFFKVLNHELHPEVFEQWVYQTGELEIHMTPEDYLEFVSLDFKDRYILHEVRKIAGRYLDFGGFEKRKVNQMLDDVVTKSDNFARSLIATYDHYCKGYYFLDNIGLGYGLTFAHEFFEFEDWTRLAPDEKNRWIEGVYEGACEEAKKVQRWLETRIIVITDQENGRGLYQYIDNRTDDEKRPTAYKVHSGRK